MLDSTRADREMTGCLSNNFGWFLCFCYSNKTNPRIHKFMYNIKIDYQGTAIQRNRVINFCFKGTGFLCIRVWQKPGLSLLLFGKLEKIDS